MPVAPFADIEVTFRCRVREVGDFRFRELRQPILNQRVLFIDHIADFHSAAENPVPVGFIEPVHIVISGDIPIIEMQVNCADIRLAIACEFRKEVFCPMNPFFWLVAVRTRENIGLGKALSAIRCLPGELRHCGSVPSVSVGIPLRGHIAAASPYFVADAPKFHLIRRIMTILSAHLRQGSRFFSVAVFRPFSSFSYAAGQHIDIQPGFCADQFTQPHELIRSEGVVLSFSSPEVAIVDHRTLRTDTILPMVGISETSARPADDRRRDFLQRVQHVFSESLDIGDRAVFADPDAVINTAAKMFDKLTVQLSRDDSTRCKRNTDRILFHDKMLLSCARAPSYYSIRRSEMTPPYKLLHVNIRLSGPANTRLLSTRSVILRWQTGRAGTALI